MQTDITSYLGVILGLFTLGYWIGVAILMYHLIHFGIGTHPKRLAYVLFGGSLFLTILAGFLYMQL